MQGIDDMAQTHQNIFSYYSLTTDKPLPCIHQQRKKSVSNKTEDVNNPQELLFHFLPSGTNGKESKELRQKWV